MDSLKITTKHYYYKPVQAFFRAFELDEYWQTKVRMESPVMDLGSGDGTFGSILLESGIADSIRLSLDISLKRILAGKQDSRLPGGIQANTLDLPVKSGSVSSVFSNGVLGCLRNASENDVDATISEVHRILQDQGVFFASVATPHFNENLLLSNILAKIGFSKLAKYYRDRLNRRIGNVHSFPEALWREKLEAAGFKIEHVRYYFTPVQARWWNILTLNFFRVLAVLKLIGPRTLKFSARLQETIFRPVFEKEQSLPQTQKKDNAGYLLFVARKSA